LPGIGASRILIGMKHLCILLTAAVFLAGFTGVAWAEEPILHGGWGGFAIGVRSVDTTDLNDYLDELGIDGVSSFWPTLELQGHGVVFEHLVAGFRGGISAFAAEGDTGGVVAYGGASDRGATVDADGINMDMAATYFQIDVGYAVLNGPHGFGFAYLGLGGGATRIYFEGDVWQAGIGPHPSEIAAADAALLKDEGEIRRSYLYTQVGFSYFWPVRFARSPYGAFGMFMPGVTAGLNLGLLDSGWEYRGDLYRGGPDLSPTGGFLQIEIAFGGGVKEVESTDY